jgi:GT2 family glycosyltransferase
VLASTYENKRVIVADNASTDDSIAFLQQHYPLVEIIQNEKNEGFAGGYNIALRQVRSDYYILLNSDVEVSPGWIEPVISLMESDFKIAACQPKLLSFSQKDSFEYAGASGGWIDRFGYPFSRGRVFETIEKDTGQYDDPIPCFWASGAALFIRASCYHDMGGLDSYFFAHQEEIDLCWRLQLAGYKIYVQPRSVVYHVGGGTLPKGNARKTYLNFRNNLIMMWRNQSFFGKLYSIPVRFILDGVAAWSSLLSGDFSFFTAVFKAHIHFIKWLIFEKNNYPLINHDNNQIEGWYRGSVVWDYFIRKRKTFSEIVG